MNYPFGLTSEQRNRIERARDLAEIGLRKRIAASKNAHAPDNAKDFVFAVFKVLSTQMAEAERDGKYSGSEGRNTLEQFVERELIPHAYELAGIAHYYLGFQSLSLQQFRTRLMEHIKSSDLWTQYLQDRLSAWSEVPGRSVTANLITRRKKLVRALRDSKGMTAPDFARYAGMSDTAIRGVVKEDRSRFNSESQEKLLKLLGIDAEEWYRI